MTDENLNVVETEKTKECNCPVCKLLKSDGLKKFLAVTLASFIGCSLAILVFAPKKHFPHPKRPHPPYMRMIDRPMPPHNDFRNFDGPRHKEFRGEHKNFKGKCRELPAKPPVPETTTGGHQSARWAIKKGNPFRISLYLFHTIDYVLLNSRLTGLRPARHTSVCRRRLRPQLVRAISSKSPEFQCYRNLSFQIF